MLNVPPVIPIIGKPLVAESVAVSPAQIVSGNPVAVGVKLGMTLTTALVEYTIGQVPFLTATRYNRV